MKDLIPLNEAEGKVKVVRIEGGKEVEKKLKYLNIDVGEIIDVERVTHEHYCPLTLKVGDRDIVISRGISEKIDVEDKKTLLEIERGKTKIESLEKLGNALKDGLSKIEIV